MTRASLQVGKCERMNGAYTHGDENAFTDSLSFIVQHSTFSIFKKREVNMRDVFEVLAVGFSATMFFSTILGFIVFMRYIAYKEKEALKQYGRKEASHE